MSDSESSSQANQTTNYTDARMVLGQDAVYGSTVTRDSGNTSTFNTSDSGNTTSSFTTSNSGNTSTSTQITALDGGAIGHAFDSTDNTVGAAFKFGGDALKGAYKFGTDAFGFSGDTVDKSMDFAQNTMARAFADSRDSTQSALSFAKAASERASSSMADAFGSALNFGAKQTQTALDGLGKAASLVDSAYADAKGRGAMTDYILMASIAGALLVAYMATRRRA